jgi:cardiolipin synthase
MRHLPNIICLVRIGLVWPIIASVESGAYGRALVLFLFAAASDGLDGYLAKRFGWTSELGKVLDPLADKLLLISLFLAATWLGLIPRWLTTAAVARDVLIGLGAITFRVGWGPLHGRPTFSSKLNTLLQLLYVLAVILHAGFDIPPQTVLDALAVVTLITVLISCYGYVREYTARALRMTRTGS